MSLHNKPNLKQWLLIHTTEPNCWPCSEMSIWTSNGERARAQGFDFLARQKRRAPDVEYGSCEAALLEIRDGEIVLVGYDDCSPFDRERIEMADAADHPDQKV